MLGFPVPEARPLSLSAARPLRTHQRRVAGIVAAMASGEAAEVRDILAAVTPGGGKSR